MTNFQAWTQDSEVFCQDKRIDNLKPGMTTEVLRGFAYIVAVKDADGNYIGWKVVNR